MKLFGGIIEINFSVKWYGNRKRRVLKELKKSRIAAVKMYRELYGVSMTEAIAFVKKHDKTWGKRGVGR